MTFSELRDMKDKELSGKQTFCNRCLLQGTIGKELTVGLNVTIPPVAPAFFYVNCLDQLMCERRQIPLKKLLQPN
jgi:hypothetical protein